MENEPNNNQLDLDAIYRAPGMQSFLRQLEQEFEKAWEKKANQTRVAQNIAILQALRGNISIRTLGQKAQVNVSQISRFLTGRRKMSFYNLIHIAQALDVKITTLLNANLAVMLTRSISKVEGELARTKI